MKVHLVLLLVCFFLLNCSKKEEVKNEVYIISEEDRAFKKKIEEAKVPPPSPGFYGPSNIIIDKEEDLYFYQRENRYIWNCIIEENPLPEFIDLQPKDLVKVPRNSVADFLKENTISNIKEKRYLTIASQLDTLKSEGFFNIMDFLTDNKVPIYLIRRTTQEEDVVLKFKESDEFYNPDSIEWDKSRIRFFDSK